MATEVRKVSRIVDSWKMKRWYRVIAPAVFGNGQIGETIAAEESQLIGRTITTSLMNVIGDPKKQSLIGTFEIVSVNQGNAETKLKKLEIAPPSVRRMIRKGKERLDMSFLCATKDNVVVRLKPLLLTRGKTGGSVLTKIRHLADAVSRVEASKVSFDELVHSILSNRLQKMIKQRVNRLYPLRSVEIRALEISDFTGALPPIPTLPELIEEKAELTEEEKIEKTVKSRKEFVPNIGITDITKKEDKTEEVKEEKKAEEKPKKEAKEKKAKKEE
ncbi:hypothetical protein JXB27_02915 [Candidatus Woesearchaeota archaeon]|nr:hypothetical protein [Candidatus Woesearchaeota archaeon]